MSAHRSLWPREHGAYAQLLAPLAMALVVRTPVAASWLLAAAAVCAFLANEPLLVVLGHRGKRLRETDGRRAAIRLAITAGGAVIAAALGLVLASRVALAVAALAAAPGALVVVLAWRRAERSLAGELVAALALPGAAAPVAVASGVAPERALVLWLAWALGYGCTVVAVHRVIVRHRHPASRVDRVAAAALVAIVAASCAVVPALAPAVIVLPLALVSAALVIRPPRASYLRAIGIAYVVASLAGGAAALALA